MSCLAALVFLFHFDSMPTLITTNYVTKNAKCFMISIFCFKFNSLVTCPFLFNHLHFPFLLKKNIFYILGIK